MKNQLHFLVACCLALGATSCEEPEGLTTPNTVEAVGVANISENAARKIFALDADRSVVEWWGHSPNATHHGSFAVTSENIEVVNGKVKQGSFSIPIASIQNFDLPDNVKPVLLDHLKSPDFFNMALYPEASFEFRKMTPLTKAVTGAVAGANYMVSGDFTMLGKTVAISFPALVRERNGQLSIDAKLKIDRTRWGMNYNADPSYGDHQIYPEVDLHLKLSGFEQ